MPRQKPRRSRQDYVTPADFIAATKNLLGIKEFGFDFAADAVNSKGRGYFDERRDAFSVPDWWNYVRREEWGWLNPPFTNIALWAEQCSRMRDRGRSIAFLTPAAVGSNWFRDYVEPHALVLALNGRLCFMPEQPTWGYPKDCILSLFGPLVTPGFRVWNWREQLAQCFGDCLKQHTTPRLPA